MTGPRYGIPYTGHDYDGPSGANPPKGYVGHVPDPEPPGPVMMACGHASNATTDKGDPVCAVHVGMGWGWDDKARTPDPTLPNLAGRTARCYCGHEVTSATTLAFFQHVPDQPHDVYYDGCRGWD